MVRILLFLCTFCCSWPLYSALLFNAGPEVYYMQRFREGGTWQSGRVDGFRIGFDRLKKDYAWYFGADYFYAKGYLSGENAASRKLESKITDEIVEVRAGFSLQNIGKRCPYFVPFAGWGWFKERNDFLPPSPIPVKFKDTFNYVVAGFLSGVNISPLLSMGINFKVRFMLNGKSKVTEDPVFDDVELLMENETHYRLDIPLTYSKCGSLFGLGFQLAPFYEFRHFGGREGFPFNFRDTKFHLWGVRLAIIYGF